MFLGERKNQDSNGEEIRFPAKGELPGVRKRKKKKGKGRKFGFPLCARFLGGQLVGAVWKKGARVAANETPLAGVGGRGGGLALLRCGFGTARPCSPLLVKEEGGLLLSG